MGCKLYTLGTMHCSSMHWSRRASRKFNIHAEIDCAVHISESRRSHFFLIRGRIHPRNSCGDVDNISSVAECGVRRGAEDLCAGLLIHSNEVPSWGNVPMHMCTDSSLR